MKTAVLIGLSRHRIIILASKPYELKALMLKIKDRLKL